jgi:hypothetical protein
MSGPVDVVAGLRRVADLVSARFPGAELVQFYLVAPGRFHGGALVRAEDLEGAPVAVTDRKNRTLWLHGQDGFPEYDEVHRLLVGSVPGPMHGIVRLAGAYGLLIIPALRKDGSR